MANTDDRSELQPSPKPLIVDKAVEQQLGGTAVKQDDGARAISTITWWSSKHDSFTTMDMLGKLMDRACPVVSLKELSFVIRGKATSVKNARVLLPLAPILSSPCLLVMSPAGQSVARVLLSLEWLKHSVFVWLYGLYKE